MQYLASVKKYNILNNFFESLYDAEQMEDISHQNTPKISLDSKVQTLQSSSVNGYLSFTPSGGFKTFK